MLMKILFTVIAISFLLFVKTSEAQILGCTDPLATNYNSSATQNDGSCSYNTSSVSPTSSFNLTANLTETSGLIKWNDQIWTHNDNSDINIYSLDTINGNLIQSYLLSGAVNNDWEEISQDSNFVYIGDFGNNSNGNRTDLKILRIVKNSILVNAPVIDTINFSYSDQIDFTPAGANNTDFDCEAFIVTSDSIFLFTKQWVSNKTSLYSLAKTPGTHIAKLKTNYNIQGLATGATTIEVLHLTVLCGYSNILQPFIYLLYDYNSSEYFSGNKRKITISLPFHQVEGIATTNGLKYYISNEFFSQPPFINNPQKIHILDLSTYLSNYINNVVTDISEYENQNEFYVFPNPATNQINVHLSPDLVGNNFTITNQSGKIVMTGKLKVENSTIELGNLSGGIYILRLGNNSKQTFILLKD